MGFRIQAGLYLSIGLGFARANKSYGSSHHWKVLGIGKRKRRYMEKRRETIYRPSWCRGTNLWITTGTNGYCGHWGEFFFR